MKLTVRRMRVIALAHVPVAVSLFLIFTSDSSWTIQHIATTASTVMPFLNALIFFVVGVGRVEVVVDRAPKVGYKASEEQKRKYEEYLQESRKLVLICLTVFLVLYMLHLYYLESTIPGLFIDSADVMVTYIMLTYMVPFTLIFSLILRHTYMKYPHARALAKKAIEGAKFAKGNEGME